ncbi:glycosyltransferase, partial [bacterium]|nr:glycosyltransferase [bacterium]
RSLQLRWRTRYTLAKTSVLLADCEAVAQKAVSFGFPRDRIRVFPWGVDLAHFNPEGTAPLRKKLKWQKNIVFLCNRTMEPLYGVDVVLNAFIEAIEQFPQARLILMGKGSQEESLRQQVDQAGMGDRVYFGGFASRADLPGIYRSADVYVSASHSDGSSVSLMEALACGKPALVSDIPGNREWIQTDVQGWLFKDGDASELAAKMKMICENGVEPLLSTNARLLAEARANWGRNFQSLMDAYELALRSV